MIVSQLSTCEECRDGKCAACRRYKRRLAAKKRQAKKARTS